MKKVIAILLVIVLALGMFAGCEKKPDKIVIAGIYKAGDQEWFIGEGAAAKAKCLEMGADEFQFIDAKMSGEEYLRALDNAIASKVSGILVCVPDQTLSAVTVEKCKEAGIPVIAADDALEDDKKNKLAPWVGIDGYVIGEGCGKWAAEYYQKAGFKPEETAVLFMTMDTVSSCVPRTDGAEAQWNKLVGKDTVAQFRADYDGQIAPANTAAANVLAANPKIKNWIVLAPNDEGAVGATLALEEATLNKTSAVCGIGGYEAKKYFVKEDSCFKATAFINYVDVGAISAEALMNNIINGTAIPMETKTPAVIVNKDNYKEVMKDQAN